MSRVFVSAATGADVYVFAEDHCPPHVHARHRGEGWIARVVFTFLGTGVSLLSITPLPRAPTRRTMNCLLDEVQDQLALCRRAWWRLRRTTCLENQWVRLEPTRARAAAGMQTAKQIASASYAADMDRVHIVLHDGAAMEVDASQ